MENYKNSVCDKIKISRFNSRQEKLFIEFCQRNNIKYSKNDKNDYVLSFEFEYIDEIEKIMTKFWNENNIKYKVYVDENEMHHYEFESSTQFINETYNPKEFFSNSHKFDYKSELYAYEFNENELYELYSPKKSEIPPMPKWKKLLGKVNKKIIENYNNYHENKDNEERWKIGKEKMLKLAFHDLEPCEIEESTTDTLIKKYCK